MNWDWDFRGSILGRYCWLKQNEKNLDDKDNNTEGKGQLAGNNTACNSCFKE